MQASEAQKEAVRDVQSDNRNGQSDSFDDQLYRHLIALICREGQPDSLKRARDRFEANYIRHILELHAWRINETADALGINRVHLWKRMKQLGFHKRSES
ncbi:MAG: hypothetical protein KDD65_05185 [Bacteroidetes bacterium]|nr:hypothetical protein [Bacteroidota bacterium]